MSALTDVLLPDIGDFADVEVIEIVVNVGAAVDEDDVLLVIESDKASMDVPSPHAGVVTEVAVAVGERISTGSLLVKLSVDAPEKADIEPATGGPSDSSVDPNSPHEPEAAATPSSPFPSGTVSSGVAPLSATGTPAPSPEDSADFTADVVVLGSGPGGYTAAFRAADLGLNTVLVERHSSLGGVCLNVGCIPSKAYLHTAEVLEDARAMEAHGITFGAPSIDLGKLRGFKEAVVERLTNGLASLAKQRKVRVIQGEGAFTGPNHLRVVRDGEREVIAFRHAIVAAGSEPTTIPGIPEDPRIVDSTGALELSDIPERMLVIGGGIIGLEMATVYAALGSRITVVELLDTLMPGCDRDLVQPLRTRLDARFEGLFLGTKVTALKPQKRRVKAEFEGESAPASGLYDKVLIAIGRRPNGGTLGLDTAGVNVDDQGFVPVDDQQRTNIPHIFAIGDICGQPMLAHKATHEGKVAAEVIAGLKSRFDPLGIPSVAYTDPEVAWGGLTEEEAKAQGIEVEKAVFPWAANGRALGMDRSEGFTKLLFDKAHGRVLGAGIVGRHAGDLISEAALALELGADAEDLGLTIHPHPTLSETINFAAEMVTGSITDLYLPRKKSN